jgi:hypothetical protein
MTVKEHIKILKLAKANGIKIPPLEEMVWLGTPFSGGSVLKTGIIYSQKKVKNQ